MLIAVADAAGRVCELELGERETTLTCRLEPSPHGTLMTVVEEGCIGRSEAACGNAENGEKVLSWLDRYRSKK
jgi:hypothetical protein